MNNLFVQIYRTKEGKTCIELLEYSNKEHQGDAVISSLAINENNVFIHSDVKINTAD